MHALTQTIILRTVLWAIAWILKNATLKLYSSPTPAGKRLGGHDVTALPDTYFILDIRAGSKILLLGYFQTA